MRADDPPGDFARVRELLQGAPFTSRPRSVVTTMLRVLFTGDTDTEISARGFTVRFIGGRTLSYVTEPAAATLHVLLSRANICPRGQALAFRLAEEDGHALVGFADAARWVWIFPGDDLVLVSLRRPTCPGPPPADLPPLPLPTPVKKLYAHLALPLACPCCGRVATVYRAAPDAWICGDPRCGRSFSPPQRTRALAELREDAGVVVRESSARPKIYR